MERVLRVVLDGPRDPWLNMAIDEAIARLRSSSGVDTLRLYMWLPSGVSIGRRQDARSSVVLEEIERLGFKLVRRPTGGAALLHPETHEITYSIAISRDNPIYSLDVVSSSARIAEGIAIALRRLGAEAGVRGSGEPWIASFCYINPGSSDVIVMGKKISGSAQRRDWGSLLQHGTLLLRYDHDLFIRVIRIEEPQASEKVMGLWEFIDAGIRDIMDAMVEGFREALGYRGVIYGSLKAEEISLAMDLYRYKYSTPEWNLEGRAAEEWR